MNVNVGLLDGTNQLFPSTITVASINDSIFKKLSIEHDGKYYGLAVVDERKHFKWLDTNISLSDMANGCKELNLTHAVKFFTNSFTMLDDISSIELYFLESHQQLLKDQLDLSIEDYIDVCALLLQVYLDDYNRESFVNDAISSILPLPLRIHSKFSEIKDLDEKVFDRYKSLKGTKRGSAMLRYMGVVQKCGRYGSRYFNVKDEGNKDCILAINSKGIHIFTGKNTSKNCESYYWDFIENFFYHNNKFSIDVREPKRIIKSTVNNVETMDIMDEDLKRAVNDPTTQFSSSSRRSKGPSALVTLNFLCDVDSLTISIWNFARDQHQFFLDQLILVRQKSTVDQRDLSNQLNRLISKSSLGSSLPSLSSINSSVAMPSARVGDRNSQNHLNMKHSFYQKSEDEKNIEREKYNRLKRKRMLLKERLEEKLKELLAVCMQEGEITGVLPMEIETALPIGVEVPKIKRRIGTAFTISEDFMKVHKDDKMGQMETDVEIHRKIVAAAERLAKDKSTNKSVRKKRQKDYQAAAQKLKGLEMGLKQMRLSASKPDVSSLGSNNSWNVSDFRSVAKSCPTTPRGSVPDLRDGDKSEYEDDEPIPRTPSVASRRAFPQRLSAASSSTSSGVSSNRKSFGQTSNDEIDGCIPTTTVPLTLHRSPIYENVGYRSTSYRSSYRQAHYPTLQDDQHMIRKRAVSAHTIHPRNGNNEKTPTDEDVTPTMENPFPMRRIPQSISCSAGFAAGSLDRKSANAKRATPMISGVNGRHSSPSTQTVTTFPVCNTNMSYDTALPRFQPPLGRAPLSHFPLRGALPPYSTPLAKLPTPATVSASRIQGTTTDPAMEALLQYYKNNRKNHNTATIV